MTKKVKNDLSPKLHTSILNGKIKNRNQLIGFLTKNDIQVAMVTDDFITVKLPGTEKNKCLKGPLFEKNSDYQKLIEQHHESKIPKFLNSSETLEQQAKLAEFIKKRSDFNHKRYFTSKPGAKCLNARTKPGDSRQNIRSYAISLTYSSKHEVKLKGLQNIQIQQKAQLKGNDSSTPDAPGMAADTSSLEAQIGSLSLQLHTLMVQVAGAKGKRLTRLQAQIIMLQHKISALNIELEKAKANSKEHKNTV